MQQQIEGTGWQIDALVSELYGLTEEGVTVVAGMKNLNLWPVPDKMWAVSGFTRAKEAPHNGQQHF